MKPEIITAIGVGLGVLGMIVAGFGGYLQSNESSTEAKELKRKLSILNEQNTVLNTQLDSLRGQNEELKNINTGGDSYLKLELVNNGKDSFGFFVTNKGKYPLTNCQMWIQDMNHYNSLSNIEKSKYILDSEQKLIDLGQIPALRSKRVSEFLKADKSKGEYLIIHLAANNGKNTQVVRMKFVNNKWVTANKYIFDGNNVPVYEIPDDYPALKDKDDTFNNYY